MNQTEGLTDRTDASQHNPAPANQSRKTSMDESGRSRAPVELEWGHPLTGPKGERLRVPFWAYEKLQEMGLKRRYSTQLHPRIYQLLTPEYDSLTDGLRHLLGPALTGPEWLVCNCRECEKRETDNTHLPRKMTPGLLSEKHRKDRETRRRLRARRREIRNDHRCPKGARPARTGSCAQAAREQAKQD